MNKQTEALRLALEALEYISSHYMSLPKIGCMALAAVEEAMAEQPAQEDPCPGCRKGGVCRTPKCGRLKLPVDHPLRSEQPAQQQEPVAWRNAALRVGEDLCSVGPFGYYDMTAEQWLDWALSVVTVHAQPPQRKPLTDEEIYKLCRNEGDEHSTCFIFNKDGTWSVLTLARAIEAAHGIKEKP